LALFFDPGGIGHARPSRRADAVPAADKSEDSHEQLSGLNRTAARCGDAVPIRPGRPVGPAIRTDRPDTRDDSLLTALSAEPMRSGTSRLEAKTMRPHHDAVDRRAQGYEVNQTSRSSSSG
jgi:hypothetical protein